MAFSFDPNNQELRMASAVHACALRSNLNDLRKDGLLCDMRVRVQNEEFDAHSVVLAASCEYFRSVFTSGMKESTDRLVHLKEQNLTSRGFRFLLEYMYTGDFLSLSMENVYEILDVANHIQYEGAIQRCSDFIVEELLTKPTNVQNHVSALNTAEMYGLTTLNNVAMDGIKENFTTMSTEAEFPEMISKNLLDKLLAENDLMVRSEVDVLDAVLTWLNFDLGHRLQYTNELLSKVRLILIDPYILNELSKRKNAAAVPQLHDMVVKALVQHALPCQQVDIEPRGNFTKVLVSFADVGGPLFPSIRCEYVDMSSKSWKDMSDFRLPNQSASLSNKDHCTLYGYSFYISLNKTYIYNYNIALNQWINLKYSKPNAEPWEKLTMLIMGKCLYVSQGTEIQRFNFRTGQWQYMRPVTGYDENFTTILSIDCFNKYLLVFGQSLNSTLLYGFLDPELNKWIASGVAEELSTLAVISMKVFDSDVCVVTHCLKSNKLELWIGKVNDTNMQISWSRDMSDTERCIPQRYQDSVVLYKGKVYLIMGSYWYDTGAKIATENYGVDLRNYVPDILLRLSERKKRVYCEMRLRWLSPRRR